MRKLSNKFTTDLKKGSLEPFLNLVHNDHSLDLQIRHNEINIYYKGSNLVKISQQGEKKYSAFFDRSYLSAKTRHIPILPNTLAVEVDVSVWISQIPFLKHAIDLWLSKHPKDEREYQQLLTRENNVNSSSDYFICDIEYDNGENARFDLIALKWQSVSKHRKLQASFKPRLAFIEMKYGDGALSGSASMQKHLDDAERFIGSDRFNMFQEEMLGVFRQKRELELIHGLRSNKNQILELSDQKPEFIFLLAGHDPESNKLYQVLSELKEMRHAELKFAVATFAGYSLHTESIYTLSNFREKFNNQIFSH